jgi:HEAT repeat protein
MLWWKYQQLRIGHAASRLAVVEKLAVSDDDAAVGPLIFALKDKKPAIRVAAIKGLLHFHSRQAVSPLMERLRDPAPEVRAGAADALGQIGDPVAVNAMVGLLLDPEMPVRTAVSVALQKLGWHPGDDSQRVLQILAMGRADDAVGLGPEAVGPLLEVMRSGAPNKQFEAVRALGQIDDARVKAAMLEALRIANPAVRIAALGSLERWADESTLPTVEKFLTDSNPSVRGAAVEAVRACGRAKAVPSLLRMLKDASWEVRQASVKALGGLGDSAAVDAIAALIANDTDRDVRETAISSLGRLGNRRAVPQLVLALVDKDSTVRAAAAAALKSVDPSWEKNPSVRLVLPKLKAALENPEYWVRHSATKLFAQLKIAPDAITDAAAQLPGDASPPHPAFSVLADLMFDHDRDLRLAAVEAFRHLHEINAVPLLGAAVHDLDQNVQQAAQHALDDIQ